MSEQPMQHGYGPPPPPSGPALMRRNVRKGTAACWECKNRKTRCTFESESDPVCYGCKSRKKQCIPQDYVQEASEASQSAPAPTFTNTSEEHPALEPAEQHVPDSATFENNNTAPFAEQAGQSYLNFPSAENAAPGLPSNPPTTTATDAAYDGSPFYDDVGPMPLPSLPHLDCYNNLLRAWPSKHDIAIILEVPSSTSAVYHGVICVPYKDLLNQSMPSLRDLVMLPPASAHPVVIARRLLILAIFLQSVPDEHIEILDRLSIPYQLIMQQMVDVVQREVLCKIDLLDTVDVIECIMMKSMYHNNDGHLTEAFLAIHTAMAMARAIHLDQPELARWVKTLEPCTSHRIHPDLMWFRIVQSHTYLSMILGLPQSQSASDRFEFTDVMSPEMQVCGQMEMLERFMTVAGSYVIDRNASFQTRGLFDESYAGQAYFQANSRLRRGSDLMPAEWWRMPELKPDTEHAMEGVLETIRLMNQFAYYNILLYLNLRFILKDPQGDPECVSGKQTAAIACRELLQRYIGFHESGRSTKYCRGIDFIAFTACTAMCMAQIDERHRSERLNLPPHITHGRLVDRPLMKRTLEIIERRYDNPSKDKICAKILRSLGTLLTLEDEACGGALYQVAEYTRGALRRGHGELGPWDEEARREAVGADGPWGRYLDREDALIIGIPGTFTVKIWREVLGARLPAPLPRPHDADWEEPDDDEEGFGIEDQGEGRVGFYEVRDERNMYYMGRPTAMADDEWDLQGVDKAFFEILARDAALDYEEGFEAGGVV